MVDASSGRAMSHASDRTLEPALQSGPILIDERTIIREDCVSRRYVTLTESGIIVSKRKSPQKTASSWPFIDGCKVQPSKGIATRVCTVLHSRYTVLSLSYKNSKQSLFCFRIIWPTDAASDKRRVRLLAFTDQATATAWHAAAIAAVSQHSTTVTRSPSGPISVSSPAVPAHARRFSMPAVSPSVGPTSRLSILHDSGISDSPMPAPMDTPPGESDAASAGAAAPGRSARGPARPASPASDDLAAFHTALDSSWTHVSSSGGEIGGGSGSMQGVPPTPQYARGTTRAVGRVDRVSDLWPESGTDLPSLRRATSEDSNLNGQEPAATAAGTAELTAPLRTWGRFRLVNGLAIWREGSTADYTGGDDANSTSGTVAAAAARARAVMERAGAPQLDSFMVSHRIRGSPRQVVRTLLRLDGRGSAFWAFESISEVRELRGRDGGKQFKAIMAPPNAFQAAFVRRREFFLQLSVRRDDDDCYVVLLHSIPAEQEGYTFTRTPGTVEGRIVSMGFTIAPLKPRYRGGSSAGGGTTEASPPAAAALGSQECLVTLVLSMDLRGWLGARALLRYTLPFWSELQRGWVEALLMSLVALGNKVDQDCFVRGEEDLLDMETQSFMLRPSHASLPVMKTSALPPTADAAATAAAVAEALADAAANKPAQATERPATGAAAAEPEELATTPAAGGGEASEALPDGVAAARDVAEAPPGAGVAPPEPDAQPQTPQTRLDPMYYSSPGAAPFKVRGKNYLSDRKKVPSEEPVFRLAGMELLKIDTPVYHISRFLPAVRQSTAPFSFVMCLTLPYARRILALVLIFEADGMLGAAPQSDDDDDDDEEGSGKLSPFDLCMARFLADKGPLRDAKLKLIPSLAQGSWVVRQAVGQTPVILGKRLKTEYFMENAYLEADVDISANATAAGVTSLVAGAIKSLVFDIGIVLEGHSVDELPERLLGSVRLNHLDLKAAIELDTSVEIPSVPRQVPAGFMVDGEPRRATTSGAASS